MRPRLCLHLAILSFAVAGSPAEAATRPGGAVSRSQGPKRRTIGDLARLCASTEADATGWCAAYIMGAADLSSTIGEGGAGGLCNASYRIEQLPKLYLAWAGRHPELAEEDMIVGVAFALRSAFPCPHS